MAALLEEATATGDGPTVSLRSQRSRDEVLVQVDISGVATVELYGRAAARLNFILLHSLSSSGIVPIARVAEIKAKVASISSGAVNAEVYLDE